MKRDLVLPLFESIDVIESIESIVPARFDRSGLVGHANAGYRRMAAGQDLSLRQRVTQPRMEAVPAGTPEAPGTASSDLIAAACPDGELRPPKGSIVVEHDGIALVAGFDIDGAEALASSVLALNDGLNGAYRELWRSEQALEAREDELLKMSLTDALTGVGNRRMPNDTHRHEMGAFVLKGTGATPVRQVRLSDIATRMGGEEFVVLLPAIRVDEALVCAERMRVALEEHDFGLPTAVTSSFGVACLRSGESGAEMLARADRALYVAKQ